MTTPGQTPSQTIGPFFHDALMRDGVDDLDPERRAGDPVVLSGTLTDGSGAPIDDAMLEVWQPDGAGRFLHPLDRWDAVDAQSFVGFGRVATDQSGGFRLRTVMPGRIPHPSGEDQAPHLNVHVFARGLLDRVMTRIYFEGDASHATDPVLRACDPARRHTLVAVHSGTEEGVAHYRFDIRLQGDDETVFFTL